MRVVYFKSDFGDWGYRVEKNGTIWLSVGFKTKRAAMRDYGRNKPLG